ncbi:MAG: hypothetical protein ACOZAR_03140 [Patescibacteria group bacterium]
MRNVEYDTSNSKNIELIQVVEETAHLEEKIRDFGIFWEGFEKIADEQKIDYPPLIKNCPFIRELLDKFLPRLLNEVYREEIDKVVLISWNERIKLILKRIGENPRELSRWTRENMMNNDTTCMNRRELIFAFGVSKEVLKGACQKYKKNLLEERPDEKLPD